MGWSGWTPRTSCWLPLFLAIACLAFSFSAAAAELFQQRTFTDEAGKHCYSVHVPTGAVPAEGRPVLLFLHGAGQRGRDGQSQLSNTMACAIERQHQLGRPWPFVTIFPQCEDINGRALLGWIADGDDSQRALKILQQVEQAEHTNPRQRVLAGWSMGGYGAWSLAAAQPKFWSRVLVLSGGAESTGLPLQDLAAAQTPVWAIHGAVDPLIPFSQSEALVRQLLISGGIGRFTNLPHAGHDVWRQALASEQVLGWMQGNETEIAADVMAREIAAAAPLPLRSKHYLQHLAKGHVLAGAVNATAGNEQLLGLSSLLRDQLVSDPRLTAGSLPDIQREFGSGDGRLSAKLSQLTFTAQPKEIRVRGISGGRLEVRITFQTLMLCIGESELESGEHWARTSGVEIRFGTQRPAILQFEVQPVATDSGVSLKLLRREFVCADDNWYIQPPEKIEVRSPSYTAWHISTGLVGSLYLAKREIADQILGTVPGLLQQLDSQMQSIEAPGLALLLSPLPVLTPDLRLTPRRMTVSREGIAAAFDLQVLLWGKHGSTELQPGVPALLRREQNRLTAEVALTAITELSRLQIEQGLMSVNVLDISDEPFTRLTKVEAMGPIFAGKFPPETQELRTVLRLVAPLQVASAAGAATDEESAAVMMSSPDVALDFWSVNPTGARMPLGSAHFSLVQPVKIMIPKDAPDGRIAWEEGSQVRFLKCDSLEGSPVPLLDSTQLEANLSEAWRSWARENGSRRISLSTPGTAGQPHIRLREFSIDECCIRLSFDVGK